MRSSLLWLGGLGGLAALAALAACGGRPRTPAPASDGGTDITLYRDAALVQQRVELEVPPGGAAAVRVRVPAGLDLDDVRVLPAGGVGVAELRQAAAPAPPGPVELELVVRAPRPGRAALRLAYVTHGLTWRVAYTMTANAARDRAVLGGALELRNTTGIALPGARVRVIDAPLEDVRGRAAEALAAHLERRPLDAPLPVHELGGLDVADGETRVELVRAPAPRPMRSVLIYDPIGTRYDRSAGAPVMDPDLGVLPPAGPRVDESFEIERDPVLAAGLPAGPVRLLERRADGSLALLGEARLFETTAGGATSDTISVGTAERVTGRRERRELTVDGDRRRLVEEFEITVENGRPRPVEVLLREHLYRGLNWTLAYISVPVDGAAKEGPQQVAPRITIPAHSVRRVLYTVVYWW